MDAPGEKIQPAICASLPTTLRSLGRDGTWLQDWIVTDPTRLGLGQITIRAKELRQHVGKGGRLDILAYDAALDTYEVEVMLGECDADHGFRALDYWARERIRNPNARHVAVIIAEDLSGRYRTVLETLAQQLPLIAIEIRTLLVKSDPPVATTFPIVFAQPDDLLLRPADEPEGADPGAPNDEASRQAAKPDFATDGGRRLHRPDQRRCPPGRDVHRAGERQADRSPELAKARAMCRAHRAALIVARSSRQECALPALDRRGVRRGRGCVLRSAHRAGRTAGQVLRLAVGLGGRVEAGLSASAPRRHLPRRRNAE